MVASLFYSQALGLTFGPIDTIFTGSSILILIGGIYALFNLGLTDPQPYVEEPATANIQ